MIRNSVSILLWLVLSAISGSQATASDLWHVERTPGVVIQEIQFTNGDARLAGTVYLPASGDHLAAVVGLHGASQPTRAAALYRHLTEGLPAMGIAVLIYDRRGTGASSGSLNVDYETLAGDAIAGQNALAKLPRIDAKRIGFWGLSQGGWIAVLAAGRSKNAAFAISVSAPLVTPAQQMDFASTNLLTLRGYSAGEVKQMLEARKAWTGYLRGTNSRAAALDALQNAEKQPWFGLAFIPKASNLTADPEHNSRRREIDDDLVAAVRQVKIPILFIYGGSDPWVPVDESVQQLRLLMDQQHNIHYAVVANASHEMMLVEHETMAFDARTMNANAPQIPAYFMLLSSWLSRQTTE